MIINLNSSINYSDTPIMDGFKKINSNANSIFLPQDFFVLDEHFFEIQNSGIINIKKNVTCNVFGVRASSNNVDVATQSFIIRKNNVVMTRINFPRSEYQSNFVINNVSFMANDKIQFEYMGIVSNYPAFCEFYLKI